MPRRLRDQPAGSIHHITARGSRRGTIFVDDDDRRAFIAALGECQRATGWTCMAFCLMTNHYHLLVELTAPRLSVGMQVLNTTHAVRFNRRHEGAGHVFDARFHSTLVDDTDYGQEVVRYIALNPVRAGLCDRPEQWPWSSYPAAAGLARAALGVTPDAALRWFGGDRAALVSSVVGAIDSPSRPPLSELLNGTGHGLRRARRLYGYTQAELAAFLGVSQPTISRRMRADA
ncbi:MAG TPA: transposase [Gaiellales bacterium]|nr:transposase [Gaiellales bacterium]